MRNLPAMFVLAQHNANHPENCRVCRKRLDGEEVVLVAYFSKSYGSNIQVEDLEVSCRACSPHTFYPGVHLRFTKHND